MTAPAALVAALILAAGLAVGGYLIGGRYTILPTDTNAVTRLDRLTGDVEMCLPGAASSSCGFILDPPKK